MSSKVLKDIIKDILKSLRAVIVAIGCAVVIAFILWPFGYKIVPSATLFKILDKLVVFQKIEESPKIQLFSQYPNEYNLKHEKGLIGDEEILEIHQDAKPL